MSNAAATLLFAGLARDLSSLERPIAKVNGKAARVIETIAKRKAPRDTGKLQASIHVSDEGADGISGQADELHGLFQEFGTGTHRGKGRYSIRAKNAKALRFRQPAPGGPVRFAKEVSHPGVKAQEFFKDAVEEVAEDLPGAIADEIVDHILGF